MRIGFCAALIWAAAACSSNDKAATTPPPGGQGGGAGSEGTGMGGEADDASAADSQDEVVACGMMSCKTGEYCCDGTCGACAPIGTNCPLDPCGTGADGATD